MDVAPPPRRVLFVFAFLLVGGEETEACLLAKYLDPARYAIEVVECVGKPNAPTQTYRKLEALGVPVDRTPRDLPFEDAVRYLADKVGGYDVIIACQAVPHIVPALERATRRPPLIEHGGTVGEVSVTPKHSTTRFVGVCAAIRDAAAALLPGRPQHALEIPSMVDLAAFDPAHRSAVRAEWAVSDGAPVFGWVGRLDRRKRAGDFVRAAALVHAEHPEARFLVIGGPSGFDPAYADEVRALADELALNRVLTFLGDRSDVPRLLSGLDALVLTAQGEGMPHVIAEAGAAGLPVVATREDGSAEQITDGVSGLFVPHESPAAVAAALKRLIAEPALGHRLGGNLRRKVEREYSVTAILPRWEALLAEVIMESNR
jgi:glycosyltransferase involved in cell wall biosynthesis